MNSEENYVSYNTSIQQCPGWLHEPDKGVVWQALRCRLCRVSNLLCEVRLCPFLLRRSAQQQWQSLKNSNNLKHACKNLKHTWHRKKVMGKARQVSKLWTMSSPPLQRIKNLEVFSWKQEELLQRVHCCSWSLLVSSCEVDLLRGCRSRWWKGCELLLNGSWIVTHILLTVALRRMTFDEF